MSVWRNTISRMDYTKGEIKMSYQIVKKGGSVCMVDRNRNQPERYIGSIEPYTTKERLHQIQAFNKSIPNDQRPMKVMNEFGMIPTKSIQKIQEKIPKRKEDKSFFKIKTKQIRKVTFSQTGSMNILLTLKSPNNMH